MASVSTVVECLQTVEMHHSGVRSLDTFQSIEKESSVVLSVGGNNTICCWRIHNKPTTWMLLLRFNISQKVVCQPRLGLQIFIGH